MDEKRLIGNTLSGGKTLSQYYCPKCGTKLIRTSETLFWCPNCELKVGAMLR